MVDLGIWSAYMQLLSICWCMAAVVKHAYPTQRNKTIIVCVDMSPSTAVSIVLAGADNSWRHAKCHKTNYEIAGRELADCDEDS